MEELDHIDDGTAGTVFRDVLLLALLGFVAILVMFLPHLKPTEERTEETKTPGNVIVEIHWPSDAPVDMDLWVKAPGELPVGFWNSGGHSFNLLRDDLSVEGDATHENYEISYSRGIPAGEYIVNVHLYSHPPKLAPTPVKVVISVKKPLEDTRQILKTIVHLRRFNQEKTAFRFRLTAEGDLVENSVSSLRRPLITELR